MRGMSIDVPSPGELLEFVPFAAYGDADGPRGGARHLSAVLPAVSSAIGAPVPTAVHADPRALQEALGFPDARSAIVVLVDGMGFWNVAQRLAHAPYLRALMKEPANQQPISTCAPSTTVAALATFGTGTCPGLTAMAGYTQLNPATGRACQLIGFRDAPAPEDLQREPTVFESLAAQGMRATSVGLRKFAGSPLTKAALRGASYIGDERPMQRVRKAAESAREPGLTYLYMREADKVGHASGWDGVEWATALEKVDGQLAALRCMAPRGTLIVIVADHGMVRADPGKRIDIAGDAELNEGVALAAGEPRCVMLYAKPGCEPDDIRRRWARRLGDDAWVATKRELADAGFYGPLAPHAMPVIGDVVACATGEATIVDSATQTDGATRLPGVHGSRTRMEMDIPCFIDVA